MSWIKNFAPQIYGYITGFLPWSYVDASRSSSIDVLKTATGLRVITTQTGEQYKEITVDIPQEVIQSLMDR